MTIHTPAPSTAPPPAGAFIVCACCGDALTPGDFRPAPNAAMAYALRRSYGERPVCFGCMDDMIITECGLAMPADDAVWSNEFDTWFRDDDALIGAEIEAAAADADRRMMRGWL